MQELHKHPQTKLGIDSYYPVAAICEEGLNKTKECNILKYNIFDENNIRRNIYLRRMQPGRYSCKNLADLRSSYESHFVLAKNPENDVLWELREYKDPDTPSNVLKATNIEAGPNPRNIKNQFNMCDKNGTTNEISCFGVDQFIERVDSILAAHETAPQCADDMNFEFIADAVFWSCDGVALTENKKPKISNAVIYIANQPFYNSWNDLLKIRKLEYMNELNTIKFENGTWQFYRKRDRKVLGKSTSQNIFGQWVGICDDWKNTNSECGPLKYYKINSPAKQYKKCSLVLDYGNFIPMQWNNITNSYQGEMGSSYEVKWSNEDWTWIQTIKYGFKNIKSKIPDFAAPCPDDINYLLTFNNKTDSRNDRLWILESRPFPSGSPKVYDHLEYPWEHYRNDVISYCHGTCEKISVAVSLNGTREVLTFNDNQWIGGDYIFNLTHISSTSFSMFNLYKKSSNTVIASSEV